MILLNLIGIKHLVTNLIEIKTTKSLPVYIALQLLYLFLNFLLLHVEVNPKYFPYLFKQIRECNLQGQRDGKDWGEIYIANLLSL